MNYAGRQVYSWESKRQFDGNNLLSATTLNIFHQLIVNLS